jgi:hypothetical protein
MDLLLPLKVLIPELTPNNQDLLLQEVHILDHLSLIL